jgi:hypothetical protein
MGQLAVVDRQSLAINQTAAGGGAFLEEDGSARCLFPGVITTRTVIKLALNAYHRALHHMVSF